MTAPRVEHEQLTGSAKLPPRRSSWPAETIISARRLQLELDGWCRDTGVSWALNPIHVEHAMRQAWTRSNDWSRASLAAPTSNPTTLPESLAAWPPDWRYRVAELERSGATRTAAVRRARNEHRRVAAKAA